MEAVAMSAEAMARAVAAAYKRQLRVQWQLL